LYYRSLYSFPTRRSSDLLNVSSTHNHYLKGPILCSPGPLPSLSSQSSPPSSALAGSREQPSESRKFSSSSSLSCSLSLSWRVERDRKSTRLNSSHVAISY